VRAWATLVALMLISAPLTSADRPAEARREVWYYSDGQVRWERVELSTDPCKQSNLDLLLAEDVCLNELRLERIYESSSGDRTCAVACGLSGELMVLRHGDKLENGSVRKVDIEHDRLVLLVWDDDGYSVLLIVPKGKRCERPDAGRNRDRVLDSVLSGLEEHGASSRSEPQVPEDPTGLD